jgi:hypothetical protein
MYGNTCLFDYPIDMEDLIKKLRERYSDVPLLVFARSIERSRSAGDLFDILETIPGRCPLVWDENQRRWVVVNDIIEYNMRD